MEKKKDEEKNELQEQMDIQKLALEKDFKRLEGVYKNFISAAEKQEVSGQLISRCQGIRRDLRMAEESIQQITMLIQ